MDSVIALVGQLISVLLGFVVLSILAKFGIGHLLRMWRTEEPVSFDGRHVGALLVLALGPAGGVMAADAPWVVVVLVSLAFTVFLGLPMLRGMPRWEDDTPPWVGGVIMGVVACVCFGVGLAIRLA